MKRIVVLISGSGSNMLAIARAARRESWSGHIVAVISDRKNAAGLVAASELGLPTLVVERADHGDAEAFEAALQQAIDGYVADLVVLAGFLRVLSESFVARYSGRMLNIHPSLLPSFPGLRTHRQALSAGVKLHGATVHFVTGKLDHGPIVAQVAVPVLPNDTEGILAARVLAVEHTLYPNAIRWFLEGKLRIDDGRVLIADPIRPGAPTIHLTDLTD